MIFTKTKIPEVVVIEPKIFGDQRGYFFESFNQKEFKENIGNVNFVQDNESKSTYGVLRGLHFQKPPFAQAKLVRCIQGKVLDVVVDVRKDSPTYSKHITLELSEENKKQLFIPRGFAHGFVTLSKEAVFAYKVDNWYAPEYDSGIIWNDTTLNIDWRIDTEDIILSSKDQQLSTFTELKTPFIY
ncbi:MULTISPECIES: dTDP-4-dehydrorhamnose 3,5-epimerase [Tenacibaculum]|uniref:dTDP-4-dehydrorhamnose 3,5-epimerase n=1 Tax=Tenacibaculum sp. Pbs-1 TaxID=3238748 RepID=A0AB33KYQ3_9FLAO|nr:MULTISPECIES: dTDP-4-dehydrorhamnose 3,5-epimerase [Tenacibaculum]KAF9658581.1 dTDP-4-dehydrorhamnose 3,5-epimerase [Tenacibaculum mesophilum]MCG7502569.1 dTDP-4-dehydrorhamnose 3,5-epimerase [Tenacibaculum sp. Mcav3-52]GFD96237.1 dTDP-4-dehydrorhamnose 3,5-epimerase [Alteromonas sp. KUL154]GFE00110.1 dTDP-4-dehydrorhamnose 3,5-epimerase [Alteromonas sp. KUL156]